MRLSKNKQLIMDGNGNLSLRGGFKNSEELFNLLEDYDCYIVGDCAGVNGGLADLIYNSYAGCVYLLEEFQFDRLIAGHSVDLKAYAPEEFGLNIEVI